MKTVEYTLPDWTLCPLFNSDCTGITDEEETLLNEFLDTNHLGLPVGCEELGFCWRNDLDYYGGNCHTVVFPIN